MDFKSIKNLIQSLVKGIYSLFHKEKQKPFVYVAIGDSTVEGMGASHPKKAFAPYVFSVLKKELPHVSFYNFGKAGVGVEGVLQDQIEKTIELKPDLVVISVGFNDIKNKVSSGEFEKQFGELLKTISEKTDAFIIVNTIPDISMVKSLSLFRKLYGDLLIKQFNKAIKKQVEKHQAHLVDTYAHSKSLKGYTEIVADDGLHPSDIGHVIWGNAILETIRTVLRKEISN